MNGWWAPDETWSHKTGRHSGQAGDSQREPESRRCAVWVILDSRFHGNCHEYAIHT